MSTLQVQSPLHKPLLEKREPIRQSRSLTTFFNNLFSGMCSCFPSRREESIPMEQIRSYGSLSGGLCSSYSNSPLANEQSLYKLYCDNIALIAMSQEAMFLF